MKKKRKPITSRLSNSVDVSIISFRHSHKSLLMFDVIIRSVQNTLQPMTLAFFCLFLIYRPKFLSIGCQNWFPKKYCCYSLQRVPKKSKKQKHLTHGWIGTSLRYHKRQPPRRRWRLLNSHVSRFYFLEARAHHMLCYRANMNKAESVKPSKRKQILINHFFFSFVTNDRARRDEKKKNFVSLLTAQSNPEYTKIKKNHNHRPNSIEIDHDFVFDKCLRCLLIN